MRVMKLSFVISTQPTHFVAAAFAADFEANVSRLAMLGYDGAELAVREPASLDTARVKALLSARHLDVPALGTGQAYVEEHLSFTDPDASVRERAIARIESHVALAHEFNALVILGLIRGKMQPGVSSARAHRCMLDALKQVARTAGAQRVRLVIEPINRYETDLINTVGEALALIDDIGADNVGILFDTFHANIEEPHIEESLRLCGSRLLHVHIADSNRRYPGAGHTDFARIIATLREMNYAGWVSAEILPQPDFERAAQQTVRGIRPLLA
jgi:sugar phosphate isomerase/epimerase